MVCSRHGVVSIPEMELEFRNFELELRNFELELKFPTKEIQKLIYHFYNINAYMRCDNYPGTLMIELN